MTPTDSDSEAAGEIVQASGGWQGDQHFCEMALIAMSIRVAAEERGAKAERERIVAWLRGQEAMGFERMHRADTPTSQRNYAAGAEAVKRCADAIERLEHLK